MGELGLYILWVMGVSSFTLVGSLSVRRYNRADLLIGLYVAFVIAAQVLATKIAQFDFGWSSFSVPAGVLVFSVTFLITDIVNEAFGRRETFRMIGIAFVAQVAVSFFLWLGTMFPAAPYWERENGAWNTFFGMVPRIVFASWIAFLVSENLDAYLFSWFREKTGERRLWLRNVISTIPALAIDSIIFVPIAFAGAGIPLLAMIKGQVVAKWVVALVNIPFMYLNHFALCHGRGDSACALASVEHRAAVHRGYASASVSSGAR